MITICNKLVLWISVTSHFVELSHTLEASSVADIGCNHGLLSFGLAASGIYSRVLGFDVFMQALKNALDNQHRIYKHSSSSHKNCTLEFQLGNGLETVKDSTLDVVCGGAPQGF